jgi:ribose transport system permease protein
MTIQTDNSKLDATSTRTRPETPSRIWLRRFTALAPVWTLLALGIFFSLAAPSFLRPINLNNILAQISVLAIFGTGMTFVLLTGEIDLSIAAVAGFAGMVSAQLYVNIKLEEPIPTIAALGTASASLRSATRA